MSHDPILLGTVAVGFAVAFVFGLLAVRLKLPPIVGYLIAGVVVGPFTPGYVADAGLAEQLAELGVILLMFGVGLHFSFGDLVAVRRVVIPGAIAQTSLTTVLGATFGRFFGWDWGASLVLGLCLGVASTAVLLKGLEGRDRLDSPEGRLAVGWLVVEDVLMVLALVLLPAVAPMLTGTGGADAGAIVEAVAIAVAKVVAFALLMFVVGRRFIPWLLARVANTGSRELFTLAVFGTALGIGTIAAELFGVSFPLGAFFAGAVIAESELSHRAAAEALPMQDAFAVLFFVSVGMLFDPSVLLQHPGQVLALVALVVLWKSAAAFGIVRLLGESRRTALVVGTSLGQIGEFSFVVAGLGLGLGIVSREVQAIVVAAAIVAITLNAGLLGWAVRLAGRKGSQEAAADAVAAARRTREMRAATDASAAAAAAQDAEFEFPDLTGHVVLVGYGRVGATVADALTRAGSPFVVIEEQERIVGGLRKRGEHAIQGDATRAEVLERAGIDNARLLVVTAPEPYRARRIVEVARAANSRLAIAVRTHSAAEQAFFEQLLTAGGMLGRAVYAEREAALNLSHFALIALGRTDDEADWVVDHLRGMPTAPTETFKSLATQEYRNMTATSGER